jgi:hypothetical protein
MENLDNVLDHPGNNIDTQQIQKQWAFLIKIYLRLLLNLIINVSETILSRFDYIHPLNEEAIIFSK